MASLVAVVLTVEGALRMVDLETSFLLLLHNNAVENVRDGLAALSANNLHKILTLY